MIRKKQKLYTHQRQKIKNNCTHKGVPQGRNKLHCGTPFLMVRNLSDFGFCYGFLFDRFYSTVYFVLIPTGIIVCIVGLSAMSFFKDMEKEQ